MIRSQVRHKVAKLLVQGTKVPLHAVTREQYFQYCMPVRLNIAGQTNFIAYFCPALNPEETSK